MKVRLIDDVSASHVNATVQVESAPPLHTLDVVAAIPLDLSHRASGKAWLGPRISQQWASYVVVFDPSARGPLIFRLHALPFGAS